MVDEEARNWDTEKSEEPDESKALSLWPPRDLLFEDLMGQVSSLLKNRLSSNRAIYEILHQYHDKEDRGKPLTTEVSDGIELMVPGGLYESHGSEDVQQLLPSISVGHWFQEFKDLEYQMRNPDIQKKPDRPFTDLAYGYTTAIYSMALYAGRVIFGHQLRNRDKIREARGYVPKAPKDEKPVIMKPEEYVWEYLHPIRISSTSRSMPVWAGSNRVRDTLVRIADDYAVPRQFVGFTCLVVAFSTIQAYKGDEIRRLRLERDRLIKWYNMFKVS